MLPQPPAPLGQHCTAIVNNILYAYTENGFFQLPLAQGAKWTEIKGKQVPTQGSVCVHTGLGTPDEALYVVGGDIAADVQAKNPEFMGLQKYSFAQKTWSNQPLLDKTLFNLTHHGATFLEDSKQIFVYAGNWFSKDVTPSSMAFLIDIDAMMIESLPTGLAPPMLYPIVQSLNAHTAIVSGGDPANTAIFSYSTIDGWTNMPGSLAAPLPAGSSAGTVVQGDDGSKMLLTFDFSKSPTDVELVPLFNATAANPAAPSSSAPARLRSRDHTLTSANWPNYNATLAPKDTRTDFAITSNNQYVVISGGGPADDPLCIFDYTSGGWLNATALFASQKVLAESASASVQSESTSTSASVSQTSNTLAFTTTAATALASATANLSATGSSTAAAQPAGLKTSTQLLFIIVGVVLLVGLILGTAYIILRCKRRKMKTARAGEKPEDPQSRGMPRDSGMSFKDRGASFMKEAGGSKSVMFGRKSRSVRGRSFKEELEFPNVGDLPRGAVIGPAVGTNLEMQPAQRGSGWSRYFSGNSTTNLVQNGAGIQRSPSDASRSSYSISEFPDEGDERRQSYPSIGYVRSSYASHSAVFSNDLPTPTFGDVMRDSSPPKGGAGLLGFEPPRAPGLFERSAGSQISVNSTGASSINFFGDAASHPDFPKKVAVARAASQKKSNNIPTPRGEDPSRVVSSIYSEGDRDSGILQPPGHDFNRTDSFGFFGNDRQSSNTAAPRGDQGLGWFVRD
ncbi:hypothetical protein TWF694_009891 [Orbilia ellipsospora]|uniref:Pre-mRNA splicing factor CLF1 n=1 Tax=Orbilia ellipsospora TaxID=2528407 RepID=A0AAV9XCA4_9PEZI